MRVPYSVAVLLCLFTLCAHGADLFRVATYNVENYILRSNETRSIKPPESRAKIREHLLAIKADVIA